MRRRQALLLSLGGVLSLWSAGRLRADAVLPATQVTTAAKPKSVQLFTASGAGDKDGRDWQNAMPIGALSKALGRARPGAGYLIGFDPAGGPIPLDEGQILIKVSGEEERSDLRAGRRDRRQARARRGRGRGALVQELEALVGQQFRQARIDLLFRDQRTARRTCGSPASASTARRRTASSSSAPSRTTTFTDIVISGIEARNVGRIIETERGAMLRNLLVSDCRAVGIVRGFARFRDLTDATFRNLELDADNMDGGGKNVCQLIALAPARTCCSRTSPCATR